MTAKRAAEKLDHYVELRGAIAHRGQHSDTVKKAQVEDYFSFVTQLASKTGSEVNKHVRNITGRSLRGMKYDGRPPLKLS